MIVLCCKYKRSRKTEGRWEAISRIEYFALMNDSMVSHGFCTFCFEDLIKEVDEHFEQGED